jgi:hypothetical protein
MLMRYEDVEGLDLLRQMRAWNAESERLRYAGFLDSDHTDQSYCL